MKECGFCGMYKSLDAFAKHAKARDGLQKNCTRCKAEILAERRAFRKGYQRVSKYGKVFSVSKELTFEAKERRRKQNAREYYLRNTEHVKTKAKIWQKTNPEKRKKIIKEWDQRNSAKVTAKTRRYQTNKIKRTPAWLTEEDFKYMEMVYQLAKGMEIATGIEHHVDHIYPLRGRKVSGLHVPLNLQILSASENCRKSNIWEPESQLTHPSPACNTAPNSAHEQ